jgi:membrane fusion protein (multidrug efflux system)
VKVVQRIPVKILLDGDTDKDHVLRIGMSVVPTIVIENKELKDGKK